MTPPNRKTLLLCIDCGICEPVCPADAIHSGAERGLEAWVELNARYAYLWPEITMKRETPADAKQWDGKPASSLCCRPGRALEMQDRPGRGQVQCPVCDELC